MERFLGSVRKEIGHHFRLAISRLARDDRGFSPGLALFSIAVVLFFLFFPKAFFSLVGAVFAAVFTVGPYVVLVEMILFSAYFSMSRFLMIAAHRKIKIPVSCVEQGRWRYRSKHFGSTLPSTRPGRIRVLPCHQTLPPLPFPYISGRAHSPQCLPEPLVRYNCPVSRFPLPRRTIDS
jgi:hypothetical protein